jgi:hypothetical protein
MNSNKILREIALVKAQTPEGDLREALMKPLVAALQKAAEEGLKEMMKAAEVQPPKK